MTDKAAATRERRLENGRQRYESYRDAGLCWRCGQEMTGRFSRCMKCRIKEAAWNKAYHERRRAALAQEEA
jgi:predicted amidophosphoribosyltransferase